MQDYVRIHAEQLLSDDWYVLKKTTFDLRRRDGQWQTMTRETYDRGNGATALLYNLAQRTVLLTRQFRFPAYVSGHHGYLIETAAGLLDNATPELRIRAELEEETGRRVAQLHQVFDLFMSPGSVTERLHFFVGEYDAGSQVGAGGGLEQEGEDIEVLELDADDAMAMVARGEIIDGKTVLLLQYLHLHILPPLPLAPAPAGMMILIAGPYRSGTRDDPVQACVLPLYDAGHLPVLGEWLRAPGEALHDAVFQPHWERLERLLAHCDAVLRVGGASAGADRMVALAQRRGLPVFTSLAEVAPGA